MYKIYIYFTCILFKINICLFLDYFPGARLDTADMTGVSEYPLLTE